MFKVITSTGITFECVNEYTAIDKAEALSRLAGELGVAFEVKVYDRTGDTIRTITRHQRLG